MANQQRNKSTAEKYADTLESYAEDLRKLLMKETGIGIPKFQDFNDTTPDEVRFLERMVAMNCKTNAGIKIWKEKYEKEYELLARIMTEEIVKIYKHKKRIKD